MNQPIARINHSDRLVYLVHAGIDEEQGGVVMRHDGTGRPESVLMVVREELDERRSDA